MSPARMSRSACVCGMVWSLLLAAAVHAQSAASGGPQVLTRGDETVVVDPYAPNIVRVTLSLRRDDALAAPGYGIAAKPSATGWRQTHSEREDIFASPELTVTTVAEAKKQAPTGTGADIARFFNASTPWVGLHIATAQGRHLLDLNGWQMAVPNYKDGTAQLTNDRRPTDPPFFTVGANFSAAPDEHDRTRKATSIIVVMFCAAPMITTPPAGRASVCRSSSPTRATRCFGITRPARP